MPPLCPIGPADLPPSGRLFDPFGANARREAQGLGLHHRDLLVHLRDLVPHVANVLLEDQLGVFGEVDDPAQDRTEQALDTRPHTAFPLLLEAVRFGA